MTLPKQISKLPEGYIAIWHGHIRENIYVLIKQKDLDEAQRLIDTYLNKEQYETDFYIPLEAYKIEDEYGDKVEWVGWYLTEATVYLKVGLYKGMFDVEVGAYGYEGWESIFLDSQNGEKVKVYRPKLHNIHGVMYQIMTYDIPPFEEAKKYYHNEYSEENPTNLCKDRIKTLKWA